MALGICGIHAVLGIHVLLGVFYTWHIPFKWCMYICCMDMFAYILYMLRDVYIYIYIGVKCDMR